MASVAEFRLRHLTIELGRTLNEPGYEYVLLEDAIDAMKEARAEALKGAADQVAKLPVHDLDYVDKSDVYVILASAPEPEGEA